MVPHNARQHRQQLENLYALKLTPHPPNLGRQRVWLLLLPHPDGQVTLVPSHILQFPLGNVVRQRT